MFLDVILVTWQIIILYFVVAVMYMSCLWGYIIHVKSNVPSKSSCFVASARLHFALISFLVMWLVYPYHISFRVNINQRQMRWELLLREGELTSFKFVMACMRHTTTQFINLYILRWCGCTRQTALYSKTSNVSS